jgi:2-polyprenyl-6-methoxyphenol hydroxylase-like FAD-dependent oxidoreductase
VLLSRVHEWQLGYIFPKGDFSAIRAEGIEHFRASIATRVPWLIDRVELLGEWSQVHLLVVKSDCLERWHEPGLLFLGDAAHVMSPVGGVGINFAIADAVVAANVLHEPLARGRLDDAMLAEVQRQREGPTRRIQRFQSFVQQRIIAQALRGRAFSLPWPARALLSIPYLRDVPARAFALGIGRPRLDPRLVQQPSGPNLQAS